MYGDEKCLNKNVVFFSNLFSTQVDVNQTLMIKKNSQCFESGICHNVNFVIHWLRVNKINYKLSYCQFCIETKPVNSKLKWIKIWHIIKNPDFCDWQYIEQSVYVLVTVYFSYDTRWHIETIITLFLSILSFPSPFSLSLSLFLSLSLSLSSLF